MKTSTGKVIKAFRNHLNYKQEFIAKKLNITPTTLANIENGRVGLDLEKLYGIAKIFAVAPRTILDLAIELYETKDDQWLNYAIKELKRLPYDDDVELREEHRSILSNKKN